MFFWLLLLFYISLNFKFYFRKFKKTMPVILWGSTEING